MIQPDAKCVVNGHKVNEVIDALNPLLNMDIIIGNVAQPQIQYSSGAVQIVIPPGGGASTNEELDIIDDNNQASTRWFLTTTTQGSGGAAIASGTGTNIGSTGGKNNPAATKGDRDKLGGGVAGGPAGGKNRDNLDRAAAGGGAAPIGGNDGQGGVVGGGIIIDNPQGMPLFDPTTGKAVPGTGTNLTGGRDAPQGDLADDGMTAAQIADWFKRTQGGGTTPIPLGDDTRGTPMSNQQYQAWLAAGSPPPTGGAALRDTGGGTTPIPLGDDTRGTPMSNQQYQAWLAAGSPPPTGGAALRDTGGGTDGTSQPSRDPVYAPGQPRTVDKFGKPINQAYKRPTDGRRPGESNIDFLTRLAINDPVTHGATLKRQIEADMYAKAYNEAKTISKNAGMSFDSNDFNAQWEYQAGRRKQLVEQEFNRLIGRQ